MSVVAGTLSAIVVLIVTVAMALPHRQSQAARELWRCTGPPSNGECTSEAAMRRTNSCSNESYAVRVTGKISMFGSLAQRGVAGDGNVRETRPRRRTRHVFVTLQVNDQIHERPGVLLDWVQRPRGWTARVAYVADDQGTLVVAWFEAAELTPVPEI